MKKLFLAFFLVFLGVFLFGRHASASVLTRAPNSLGLVGYWSMNDGAGATATDFSGNKNHGTLTNMDPSTDWSNGRLGKALDFDGSDDYVNAGSASNLDNITTKTVSVWVRPDAGGDVVNKDDNQVSPNGGWYINITTGISFVQRFSLSQALWLNGSGTITSGVWNHVVITYNKSATANNPAMYINGSSVSVTKITSPFGTADTDSARSLVIGNRPTDTATGFDGLIDEVRIYNRALTAAEVAALYKSSQVSQRNPNNSGLVGYWSLNDGVGATATDFSGQKNHGTLTNMDPSTDWVNGRLGKALDFDGSNDYVNAGGTVVSGVTNKLSVSAWVRNGLTNQGEFFVGNHQINAGLYDWGLYNAAAVNVYSFFIKNTSETVVNSNSVTLAAVNVWFHVVGVYDGANTRIYINGVQEDSDAQTGNVNNAGYNTIFGGGWNSVYFNGLIDEVRIYNRALTAGEVSALYRAGQVSQRNQNQSGLVGYWSLNDGAGATATDFSGNKNHGTLTNMDPSTEWVNGRLGKALDFDGSNDYVGVGSPASLDDITVKTVAAWIYPRSAGEASASRIVDKDSSTWSFRINGSNLIFNQFWGGASEGTWSSASNSIRLNTWQHVVVTYDMSSTANDAVFYINGVLSPTTENLTPSGSTASDAAGNLIIGNNEGTTRTFNGLIDEVRIYNRALTAAEVSALYQSR
ncbi:LamG domain-containing protein [Candidatus Parcubacteria bacterium]|nr:LamG domain-containing protein [Candidatus Parcubacteria bacterium]